MQFTGFCWCPIREAAVPCSKGRKHRVQVSFVLVLLQGSLLTKQALFQNVGFPGFHTPGILQLLSCRPQLRQGSAHGLAVGKQIPPDGYSSRVALAEKSPKPVKNTRKTQRPEAEPRDGSHRTGREVGRAFAGAQRAKHPRTLGIHPNFGSVNDRGAPEPLAWSNSYYRQAAVCALPQAACRAWITQLVKNQKQLYTDGIWAVPWSSSDKAIGLWHHSGT